MVAVWRLSHDSKNYQFRLAPGHSFCSPQRPLHAEASFFVVTFAKFLAMEISCFAKILAALLNSNTLLVRDYSCIVKYSTRAKNTNLRVEYQITQHKFQVKKSRVSVFLRLFSSSGVQYWFVRW